jgi:formate/nitrite transporter FocA (FNT family)
VERRRSERPQKARSARADGGATPAAKDQTGFSDQDVSNIEEGAQLRAPMIYEILRREGDDEMSRPITSLWWSGVAAGLSISFSLLAQAILQSGLPDTAWRPLVVSFGYCVGFLMVVLARQQLFTEQTITGVLPVVADFNLLNLGRLARLWGVVLAANVTGTFLAALFCTYTPALTPELRGAMLEISSHMLSPPPVEMFFRAISAGFLMAAMVWLIPSAEGAKFQVITMMTYLIAIGGFAHIVAGSFEACLLMVNGQLGVGRMLLGFGLPALAGNITGGTALFALISYAQVAKEIDEPPS